MRPLPPIPARLRTSPLAEGLRPPISADMPGVRDTCPPAPRAALRGSVLIASMIIALVIAALCGSYLALVSTEYRQARQSFQFNAATDLAEAGIEEALWSLLKNNTTAWTSDGTSLYRVVHSAQNALELGGASRGQLRVRIDRGSGTSTITSEARITHPSLPTLRKQLRVVVKQGSSIYAGVTVKENVIFNNRPAMDSYDSALGIYNATTNRGDKDSLVSLAGSIQLNDAKVWGRIAVGSSTSSGVQAPMNGGWLRNSESVGTPTFDTNAVTTGVKMDWPATPAPPVITATGGQYLHVTQNTTITLGSSASTTPTYYYFTDNGGTLSLSENTVLQVNGPVVLVVQRGLNISGYAKILMAANPNAKLTVYASENINISGTLTLNDKPESQRLMIYGCGAGGQNIAIGGNVAFTGIFHGPDWNVNLNSGANWSGAMLARYVNFSNSPGFHYDTALAGSGSGVQVQSWQILREASRRDTRVPFN